VHHEDGIFGCETMCSVTPRRSIPSAGYAHSASHQHIAAIVAAVSSSTSATSRSRAQHELRAGKTMQRQIGRRALDAASLRGTVPDGEKLDASAFFR